MLALRATHGFPLAALAPLFVLGLLFVGYCWWDIAHAEAVRYLPKWAWVMVAVMSVPLGGIIYLLAGRDR